MIQLDFRGRTKTPTTAVVRNPTPFDSATLLAMNKSRWMRTNKTEIPFDFIYCRLQSSCWELQAGC